MTTTSTGDIAGHWIAGSLDTDSTRYLSVFNPADGAVQGRVAVADATTIDRAVEAARAAGQQWGAKSLTARTRVLFAFRELVNGHRDELATLITAEHGKTLEDALGEVIRGQEVVEFACGIAHLLKGEFSEAVATKVDSHSLRQPLGVIAGITPFNFPVMVPMWVYPIAIACGNAFVLKPSPLDPSPSLRIAELWQEAGLPDGVFTVLNGDADVVNALLVHPGIDAISFVGSTPVARHVQETAVAHGKRVQALGGAKNHALVLADADIELAADAIASAAYGSAGQRCMAISAAVAVGDECADALVLALKSRAERLVVGPGTRRNVEMGPLISGPARDRVVSYIESGLQDGAELVCDGREISVPGHEQGFFVGPTLFDRVGPEMSVYRDEVFGPLLVVLRADSFESGLELINANVYGNGAAIFTSDGWAAREFQSNVCAGMVGVNVPIPVPMAYYSFGGWKQSMFGDLHAHGREGVMFCTRAKVVTTRWPAHASRSASPSYGFPAAS